MASALDHIEKTLADACRREIEQGENVWRSLPFIAAAIAFQIAALSQVLLRLPRTVSGAWWDAVTVDLRRRGIPGGLDRSGIAQLYPGRTHLPPMDAAATLMGALAQSYAVTTDHSSRINQQRGLYRSTAGLAILGSVFLTTFLVARLPLHYIPNGN